MAKWLVDQEFTTLSELRGLRSMRDCQGCAWLTSRPHGLWNAACAGSELLSCDVVEFLDSFIKRKRKSQVLVQVPQESTVCEAVRLHGVHLIDNKDIGPREAIRKLHGHTPAEIRRWYGEARISALLGSRPKSCKESISGYRCYVDFAPLALEGIWS